jgi:hypothetical protein
MSGLGLLASVGVAVLTAWGIYIGFRGALADAPPFMQGVGQTTRRDLRKSA